MHRFKEEEQAIGRQCLPYRNTENPDRVDNPVRVITEKLQGKFKSCLSSCSS
ncbi:MAG: hypothetical protein ACUBOA_08385 [Candidatus Loosdrechtia sp.]